LVLGDEVGRIYSLAPLTATFLRRKCSADVIETGERLAKRAFASAEENGHNNYERYGILEAEWPLTEAALPAVINKDNSLLQSLCDALGTFLHFSGRWDEWLNLVWQAEQKAVAVSDFNSAGVRAYEAGWVFRLCHQPNGLLACASRCDEHFDKAKVTPNERAKGDRLRGKAYELQGKFDDAIVAYERALTLWNTAAPESADCAKVINDLAEAKHKSGDIDGAYSEYCEALRILTLNDHVEGIAVCMRNLTGC
jgi:tetratricopeptide (TPR) repeat protein